MCPHSSFSPSHARPRTRHSSHSPSHRPHHCVGSVLLEEPPLRFPLPPTPGTEAWARGAGTNFSLSLLLRRAPPSPNFMDALPIRGTGARLWVHAPSLPESLLEEYFSGFGAVLDVYCPRDAQ